MELGKPGRLHGCDRFLIIVAVAVIMGMMSFGFMEYGLGYYELMPDFKCEVGGVI